MAKERGGADCTMRARTDTANSCAPIWMKQLTINAISMTSGRYRRVIETPLGMVIEFGNRSCREKQGRYQSISLRVLDGRHDRADAGTRLRQRSLSGCATFPVWRLPAVLC